MRSAWVRRHPCIHTYIHISKESSRGKRHQTICDTGTNACHHWFVPWIRSTYYHLRVACSLAPSGVGFKSLYYVSQPQGRGKSSRELMREPLRRELVRKTSEKSELPSESAQQSTIKNANRVLLGHPIIVQKPEPARN